MTSATFNRLREQVVTFGTAPALNCNLGARVSLSTALTDNITWGAPSNVPPAGEVVVIVMTQDGTGGRTVSWNAAYIFSVAWSNTGNTAGKKSMAIFVSDGSALISTGTNSWY